MEEENNNYKFEIDFFKKIIQEKPNYTEALIPLANAYTKTGQYKKGLEIDKRLAELKPKDPIVFYNIACNYSLLNNSKEALNYLNKAIKLGYDDVEYMLQDSDFNNIKENVEFKNLIKKYFKLTSF